MRRFVYYILVALLSFGIGYLIAFKPFWKNSERIETNDKFNQSSIESSKQKGFAQETGASNKIDIASTIEDKKKGKPFCKDEKILPIWNELEEDKIFNDYTEGIVENVNCQQIFAIKELDLNNDGEREFIVKGETASLCGATGNCGFWIFQKSGNQLRKLIADISYLDYLENEETPIQIQKTRTRGFSDVLLKIHITGYETSFRNFKFDGRKYIETKCVVEEFHMDGEREILSCKEWRKQSDENLKAMEEDLKM